MRGLEQSRSISTLDDDDDQAFPRRRRCFFFFFGLFFVYLRDPHRCLVVVVVGRWPGHLRSAEETTCGS